MISSNSLGWVCINVLSYERRNRGCQAHLIEGYLHLRVLLERTKRSIMGTEAV